MEGAPEWELGFGGEEVVKKSFVDLNRGVGTGEGRESWYFARSDELLRRPNVLGCRPS